MGKKCDAYKIKVILGYKRGKHIKQLQGKIKEKKLEKDKRKVRTWIEERVGIIFLAKNKTPTGRNPLLETSFPGSKKKRR